MARMPSRAGRPACAAFSPAERKPTRLPARGRLKTAHLTEFFGSFGNAADEARLDPRARLLRALRARPFVPMGPAMSILASARARKEGFRKLCRYRSSTLPGRVAMLGSNAKEERPILLILLPGFRAFVRIANRAGSGRVMQREGRRRVVPASPLYARESDLRQSCIWARCEDAASAVGKKTEFVSE